MALHRLGNPKDYVLRGRAYFTILNKKTGDRVTYQVIKPTTDKPHFVGALTGPENTRDYDVLGTIFDGETYHYNVKKSPIPQDSLKAKTFKFFWNNIDNLPEWVEVWYEGKCGACGRKLTTPESIERGLGPMCSEEA
jgi:hypothetical protein